MQHAIVNNTNHSSHTAFSHCAQVGGATRGTALPLAAHKPDTTGHHTQHVSTRPREGEAKPRLRRQRGEAMKAGMVKVIMLCRSAKACCEVRTAR